MRAAPGRLLALAVSAVVACRFMQPGTLAPRFDGELVSVVPAPASLTLRPSGTFVVGDSTAIEVAAPNDTAMRVAEMLAQIIRPSTGFAIAVRRIAGATAPRSIGLHLDATRGDLGAEGYALTVMADSVRLVAATNAGLFHGTQTIRQLLPADVESHIGTRPARGWTIPPVTIVDRPRYTWRGAMLDVARHFFTVREVEQYIDLLALYKLNTLHLHLTDDQGWRIEIKSRPQLAAVGGASAMAGYRGGYFTQDDYAELVRYAGDRFITVIPEIEMPAHSYSAVTAYPRLACTTPPGGNPDATFHGICPDSAETFRVIEDVIREVASLTPGPYIHIGADEVSNLTPDKYAQFVERAQDIVTKNGKRMIGWEEIFRAKLLPTTLVQLWRTDSARLALAHGSKLILSPAPKIYLDMKYTRGTELGLDWSGLVDVRTSYDWDPSNYLPGVTDADIVGVEAPLWSETIRNITAAEYLAIPRLPAVAEVAWTPRSGQRWVDFRARIANHAARWRLLGVNYYASPQIEWPSL
jgi:hexosaminidase